jgi:hypothetical protein
MDSISKCCRWGVALIAACLVLASVMSAGERPTPAGRPACDAVQFAASLSPATCEHSAVPLRVEPPDPSRLDQYLLAVSLHDWRERLRERVRQPLPILRGHRGRCSTCDARHEVARYAAAPA